MAVKRTLRREEMKRCAHIGDKDGGTGTDNLPSTVLGSAVEGVWIWQLHDMNLRRAGTQKGTLEGKLAVAQGGVVVHTQDVRIKAHGGRGVAHEDASMLDTTILHGYSRRGRRCRGIVGVSKGGGGCGRHAEVAALVQRGWTVPAQSRCIGRCGDEGRRHDGCGGVCYR